MSDIYHIVEIRKPLFETAEGYTVGVWDKHIKDAIRNKQYLIVKTKGLEKEFFPKWVRKNCDTFQKIYRRPDEPMVEYKIFIPKRKKQSEEEEIKELMKMGVFGG